MTTYTGAKPAGTPTWSDLLAPDVDAARAFYHAIFGWDYDIGGPEYGGYTTARLGTRMTVGMSGPPPGVALRPAAWALYFATADIEADVARAVKLGAKVLYPPMVVGEFGSMATLEDPTGAAFSFWQAGQHVGSQVTDEPGSTTWYELYTSNIKERAIFTRRCSAPQQIRCPGLQWRTTCSSMAKRCSAASCRLIPRGVIFTHNGASISR